MTIAEALVANYLGDGGIISSEQIGIEANIEWGKLIAQSLHDRVRCADVHVALKDIVDVLVFHFVEQVPSEIDDLLPTG